MGRVGRIILKFKHAWQRAVRGYDDTAIWNFDSWLCELAPKILSDQKRAGVSYPATMETLGEWNKILDQIILGFNSGTRIINSDAPFVWEIQSTILKMEETRDKTESFDELMSRIDNCVNSMSNNPLYEKDIAALYSEFYSGMKLLVKHFFSLWD